MIIIKTLAAVKGTILTVLAILSVLIMLEDDSEIQYNGDIYEGPEEKPTLKQRAKSNGRSIVLMILFAGIEIITNVAFIFFTK
ncbi:MAG: hypothetical protein NC311_06350 [Muribaculaceae bacterium]|nr:hypothetical protein [Ruminococcus flavefaciens]MCM1295143.1 hypothetical protein [Muribaculaceae bacterium]